MTTDSASVARRQVRPVAASLFMLAACTCFALNSVLVRHVADTDDLHPFQIAFFRNAFALVFILPWVLRSGILDVLRPRRFGLLSLRGLLNSLSMLTWFMAVPLMPLADLTALGFTAPLWATVLAAIALGERVRARRWTATAIGFLGALVIVRPGFEAVGPGVYLILFSSAMWAATIVTVRMLTASERPEAILFWQAVMMTGFALVPSLFVWEWPAWHTLPWLLALGLLAFLAHVFHIRAYSMQEVAALQPIDFSRLPIVAAVAWMVFGQVVDVWTWIGGAIVFAAGTYIAHREARLKRAAVAAAASSAPGRAPTIGPS